MLQKVESKSDSRRALNGSKCQLETIPLFRHASSGLGEVATSGHANDCSQHFLCLITFNYKSNIERMIRELSSKYGDKFCVSGKGDK
jgi:hypothetical protein